MITEETVAPEGFPQVALYTLKRYVLNRLPPGNAMQALLGNDLLNFTRYADNHWTVPKLRQMMQFLAEELPPDSWGTPEKVQAWLDRRWRL